MKLKLFLFSVLICTFSATIQAGTNQYCPSLLQKQLKTLELDFNAFDQSPIGWRVLTKAKCYKESAELMELYLRKYPNLHICQKTLLSFHAGQSYAFINDYSSALRYFSYSTWDVPPNAPVVWNAYVNATIAFLRKDEPALRKYRDEIAKLKTPTNLLNLRIVDNMLAHLNKTYFDVYTFS